MSVADDVTHRLSAEGADPLLLAGVGDANLFEMQRSLGVRVGFRGDALSITGTVEQTNERGCKVGGRWYNTSQYRPVPLPTRGAHVVLTVKGSNRHGRAYKQAGTATVLVDAKTRVRREGAKTLGALAPNDRVHVTGKACKADLKNGGTPDLTARQVGAHPAATTEPSS